MSGADDHDLHRVWGHSSPDGRGEQEALSDGLSVSSHSAEVVSMPKRRSYLDAAREQGVHQEREELMAENAELSADLDRLRVKAGNPLVRTNAEVLDLCETTGITRRDFDKALADQRAEIEGRVAAICKIIEAWPLCGPWFRMFAHLLTSNAMRPDQIGPMLVACGKDDERNRRASAWKPVLSSDQFKTEAFRSSAANSNSGGLA